MSSGIGSVFEFSLRILLLLNEVNEKLDEEQIGAIDYAAVYAADFGILDENLHGYGNYRYGEYLAKKPAISSALRNLVLNRCVLLYSGSSGYSYSVSEEGKRQCAFLKDEYAEEYILAVNTVLQEYDVSNLQRLIARINEQINQSVGENGHE